MEEPGRTVIAWAGRMLLGGLLLTGAVAADETDRRAAMVDEVVATQARYGDRPFTPQTLAALGRTERHRFVPAEVRDAAYANRPLPIGHGQTISQPFIVALMTDLLQVGPGDRVLEVGSGSGYQAAVLAELDVTVFTLEIVEPLAIEAQARLASLGYDRVTVRHGDGYHGWPGEAPFDGIVVTAAASHIPPPLVDQLRPGGRMVIPVGSRFQTQHLMLVEKAADGTPSVRQLLPVRFVPLTGDH
jgi:protein-L-isoaspartate(D-aspartate) O-methyltransferase